MTVNDGAQGAPMVISDADTQRLILAYQFAKTAYKDKTDSDLPPYTFDSVFAAASASFAAENVEPHREVLKRCYDFDIKHLDNLKTFADALSYVQSLITSLLQTPKQLSKDAADGFELRGLLMSYGDTLARLSIFNTAFLDKIREGSGYRDLVEDLGGLASMYLATPGAMSGPITKEHINNAHRLATVIREELMDSERPNATLNDLMLERRQIAWGLTVAHHQVHRVMAYLRDATDDVDSLVPPLFVPGTHRLAVKQAGPPPAQPTATTQPGAATPAAKSTNPMDNPFDGLKD